MLNPTDPWFRSGLVLALDLTRLSLCQENKRQVTNTERICMKISDTGVTIPGEDIVSNHRSENFEIFFVIQIQHNFKRKYR